MKILGIGSREADRGPAPLEEGPVPLDGDAPVSERQWRSTIRPQEKRGRIAGLLVIVPPLAIFAGVLPALGNPLVTRAEPLIFAETDLSSVAGQELDRVAAAGEIAHAIGRAHWTSITLLTIVSALLAVTLVAAFGGLLRAVTLLRPRTRADLRVARYVTREQTRTMMPALLTAGGIFLFWAVGSGLALVRQDLQSDPIAELGLVEAAFVLLGALILLLALHVSIISVRFVRGWRFPIAHLFRWLAPFLGEAAVVALLPLAACWTFQVLLPGQLVPPVDRLVDTRLEERIRGIALEHDLSPPAEVVSTARGVSFWRKLPNAPWLEELADWEPLTRFMYSLAVVFLGLPALCQLLLAYLSRGILRAAWVLFALFNGGFVGYLITTEGDPALAGVRGLAVIAGYTVACCALMILDLLANPTNSPRAAARGDAAALAAARRRLQQTRAARRAPAAQLIDPVKQVYRQVGCSV